MPITSVTNTASAAGTAVKDPTSGLAATSDTFLKLLVTNLQHQDPTKPQDSNEYVAQISQMTMVEQLTKLSTTQSNAAKDQAVAATVSLLGKSVSYVGADGTPVEGVVSKVDVSGDTPTITVGEQSGIDPATITTVG
ncbi:MAG: flagellar hook capping protein [Solirubrobacterales bacterium]|nr:flagellar hook capping protein [Solirubrobacterales bacterium]